MQELQVLFFTVSSCASRVGVPVSFVSGCVCVFSSFISLQTSKCFSVRAMRCFCMHECSHTSALATWSRLERSACVAASSLSADAPALSHLSPPVGHAGASVKPHSCISLQRGSLSSYTWYSLLDFRVSRQKSASLRALS